MAHVLFYPMGDNTDLVLEEETDQSNDGITLLNPEPGKP